jgi:hypothetical protein
MSEATRCHETVDSDTRAQMLAEYDHRCQGCGRYGSQRGGTATLHVHHQTRDPDDDVALHDPRNLTVFCRLCHSWHHRQLTPEDVSVEIGDDDLGVLLPQDIEIIRILTDSGPLTTGDIVSALPMDLSVMAVRERLWTLMGLDTHVASRSHPVVDQDADTGEWGLLDQIDHSARGRIPGDPQLLLHRFEDELVRRALERGCDRDAVMDVLDVSRRGTFYKERRARAYNFPLDVIDNRGGRPRVDEADDSGSVSSDDEPGQGVAVTDGGR